MIENDDLNTLLDQQFNVNRANTSDSNSTEQKQKSVATDQPSADEKVIQNGHHMENEDISVDVNNGDQNDNIESNENESEK